MRVEDQIKELSEQKDKLRQEQPISFEVVMQYAKYFLQHIDELILHQSNRLKQADFFSVIFDQTPTYAEIASVTTEVPNIPGVNELFRIKKMSISSMVRVVDNRWNHFVPSLYILQSKLERFGLTLVNGEICYLGESWGPDV